MADYIVYNWTDTWKTDVHFFVTITNCQVVRSLSLPYRIRPRYNEPRYNEQHMKARQNHSKICGNEPRYNEPRYNEIPVITIRIDGHNLSLTVRKNGMMIQIVDRPNTTPIC